MKNLVNYVPYAFAVVLIFLIVGVTYTQVKEYHLQDDPMLRLLKQVLKPVHPVFENLKLYKGDKSYTINKERTFMCLKDKNGDYYPLNHLIYVLLHEVAHILNTKDIGHTEAFNERFDELLNKATALGVYNPSIPIVQDYCGHE
jgi:hypothetical protein